MKKMLRALLLSLLAATAQAGPVPKPAVVDSAAVYQAYVDSVNATFHYQQGHVVLPGGIGAS